MYTRENVTEHREDISRFIVHLTRDDTETFEDGKTARNNFQSILKEKKIRPYLAHCLHKHKLHDIDTIIRKQFRVVCFTEVPLNQIKELFKPIYGREIQLEEYGFVFRKKFLIEKEAQPAIYINSYNNNDFLKESFNRIFESAKKNKFKGKGWRILPYINNMNEKYDFTWEREWRLTKTLKFKYSDLVCVILPEGNENDIKDILLKAGIAVISPNWTYEKIVNELSYQQRQVKNKLIDESIKNIITSGEEKHLRRGLANIE